MGESESSRAMRALCRDIRRSPRVASLLAGRESDGRLLRGRGVYAKWQGVHWVGLADTRTERLVERLLYWQWPDGGWNCDKDPNADSSSFMETLTPMRGLIAYARYTGDRRVLAAVERAATVFLDRQLFKRRSTGATIRDEFVQLHYPLYWHYDILGGLKVLAEAGMIRDERCRAALDLLESKQLPDGGFPAEARHYKKVARTIALGNEVVDWGGSSKRVANPWVTTDALAVLAAAGRITPSAATT